MGLLGCVDCLPRQYGYTKYQGDISRAGMQISGRGLDSPW
jgi:hypothetical protein